MRHHHAPFLLRLLLCATLLLLAGCGSQKEEPIVPTIEATTALPTTLPATATSAPATETPLPAPVVNTPEPTTTSEPTIVEPTAEVITLDVAEAFARENRNPLTGEVVEDPTVLDRRPILCKISNSPPQYTRPQAGLNDADLVFEYFTEGNITRFSAIFYDTTPPNVGPVRSARLPDMELVPMYDAYLCFSGASIGVSERIFGSNQLSWRAVRSQYGGYYRTGDTSKPFEHTLYANLEEMWDYLDSTLETNQKPEYAVQTVFSSATPLNSASATQLKLSWDSFGTVEWVYDEETGNYLRSADGEPSVDANTGKQIEATNLIFIKAPHFIDYNICEYQGETECLAFATEIQIWGGGFVSIFRDGRQINGSWKREDRNQAGAMFTFFDEQNNPIPLQIGNSWIHLLPYEDYYLETPLEVIGE